VNTSQVNVPGGTLYYQARGPDPRSSSAAAAPATPTPSPRSPAPSRTPAPSSIPCTATPLRRGVAVHDDVGARPDWEIMGFCGLAGWRALSIRSISRTENRSRPGRAEPGPQLALEDLAAGVQRHIGDDRDHLGHLEVASRCRQNSRSVSGSITAPSAAVTKATTISLQCSSGWPTTATAVMQRPGGLRRHV
jgi:hypothetical protein